MDRVALYLAAAEAAATVGGVVVGIAAARVNVRVCVFILLP
jgi:hypothetical protein